MASIIGISGSFQGKSRELSPGQEIIIGKDYSCGIVIDASYKQVSRRHVGILYDAARNQYRVTDYSSNGTYVNGIRLTQGMPAYYPAGTRIALAKGENTIELGSTGGSNRSHPGTVIVDNPRSGVSSGGGDVYQGGGKGFSIASMVLGICSCMFMCLSWLDLLISIPGLVLGAIALYKKKPGKGMAIAGLVCSIVSTVMILIFCLLYGAAYATMLGLM